MNAPGKIALLTNLAGNGGSAATLFHNARLLRDKGWICTFFAPGEYWKKRGAEEGVAVDNSLELRRGFRPLSFSRDFARFRRFIVSEKIDAVIVQKSPEQWLAASALMSLKRAVALVRLRGVVFAIKPSGFNRWLHNRMDAILCSASVIAAHYRTLPGFRQEHVRVLLEGIDAKHFHPADERERRAARERFGLDPAALIVGTAGRPSPVKGHEILVRAFAQAFPNGVYPSVRLAIFADESRRGPGSYGDLRALCQELGMAARVDLSTGFLPDMRAVYHALDAYALPSLGSEGSSRAGLEACASGLPVIASRVGVLPDLIEDGRTGILLPPGNIPALSAHLLAWALRPEEYRAFGTAARERIVTQFSEDRYAEILSAVLSEAIARRRGGA